MTQGARSTHLGRLWEDALLYASHVHGDQVRKGGGEVPYISHLLSVAALVLEDGGSEEEAVAALLPDAVEDQGGQRRLDDIAHRFGPRVAQIVAGCSEWIQQPGQSEGDKPSWCARKRAYLAHLREEESDESILRVAIADKVHNARSIVADLRTHGAEMARRFNADASDQVWYYRGLAEAFTGRGSPKMRAELGAAVSEMQQLFGQLPRRARVVGVDGAPYGWVTVALGEDCLARVERFKTFPEVLRAFREAEIVAVDIPVGLMPHGPRPPRLRGQDVPRGAGMERLCDGAAPGPPGTDVRGSPGTLTR